MKLSHYWPPLGGPNCATFVNGYCQSGFSAQDESGAKMRWEPWVNGIDGVYACACPERFEFGTYFVLPGGEVFRCWDRGGKVKNNWLDLMVRTAPVDYGTEVAVTIYPPDYAGELVPLRAAYPYHKFWITGATLHGDWYGHAAIDLAAGKDQPIRAPITGKVLSNGHALGNTELIIDGARYMVTMWHGNYTAAVGQLVHLGDIVGTEGNNGYVTRADGTKCKAGEDCGYHTHINFFDKWTGLNVNPLDVMTEWSN